MLNMSLEGVLIYTSLVVAPINVNLGNDMFILLADCPSPITMSIVKNIAVYQISSKLGPLTDCMIRHNFLDSLSSNQKSSIFFFAF